jgi:hypothetical protein
MELEGNIRNNLMKLEVSLGNVPKKIETTCHENFIYFGLLV